MAAIKKYKAKDIKKFRIELDMTQLDLAEKLNVSIKTVNNWENGRSKPYNRHNKTMHILFRHLTFVPSKQHVKDLKADYYFN